MENKKIIQIPRQGVVIGGLKYGCNVMTFNYLKYSLTKVCI
jgi:hypothetical protein